MKQLKQVASEWFEDNPSMKNDVVKAYYAFHVEHIRADPQAHNFSGPWRDCACSWCGRSREDVRYDDLPGGCQNRPELPEIEGVMAGEERKAFSLYDKAAREVPKLVDRLGMSGEALAILHHTHGYDPETVDSVVSVPREIMAEYHAKMELEREKSRKAIVKNVIEVKL
jgi:hypothetical protein